MDSSTNALEAGAGRACARVHRFWRAGRPRLCSSAPPGSACRRRRYAASSPGSRTKASFSSRTPRPAASRRTAAIASTSTCCSNRSARRVRASAVEAQLRRDELGRARRLAALAGLARRVAGVAPRRLRAAPGARGGGVRSRRVHSAQRRPRARRHRRARRPCDPEGHRRSANRSTPTICAQAANYLNAEFSGLPLSPRARSGARADERGAAAVRRADGARDAAGLVDVHRSARRPHAVRRRRGVAARRRSGAHARHAADAAADDRGEAAARPAAERVHRRPGPDGRHRRRTSRSRACARSASSRRTYEDGAGIGTIGVIGPTRMRYSRAIAVVDGAAQAVSRVLRDPN